MFGLLVAADGSYGAGVWRSVEVDVSVDRVVAITGGAGGVGEALTHAFSAAGYRVAILSNANPARAEDLARSLREQGRQCIHVPCNVIDPAAVSAAFAVVRKAWDAEVDILVNNAGSNIDASVRRMTADQWRGVVDVHLGGTFLCANAVIQPMIKNGFGRIINVSSIVAAAGVAGAANYGAAKAGIEGFTRSFAKEVGRSGVTVNAVALGYFDVGLGLKLPPELRQSVESRISLGRFGRRDELAGVFLFLASPAASYLNGAVIPLDGGLP